MNTCTNYNDIVGRTVNRRCQCHEETTAHVLVHHSSVYQQNSTDTSVTGAIIYLHRCESLNRLAQQCLSAISTSDIITKHCH